MRATLAAMASADVTFEPVSNATLWEALLARAPVSAWQQSWAYGAAAKRNGRTVERVRLAVDGRTVGLVQLIGRTAFAGRLGMHHALGGPSFFGDAPSVAVAAALRALKRREAGWMRTSLITPTARDGLAAKLAVGGYRRVMTGYNTALLPLLDDRDAQARRLRPSWRRSLKRAPSDLTLKVQTPASDPCGLDVALALHEASRRRRGFATVPPATVAHAAKFGRALLATAHVDDDLVAFMLFVLHGAMATYQLGWSSDQGRRLEAHHHVLWHALPELRCAGSDTLDLGGIDLPAGIVAFKLATGAMPTTLPGTFI